MQNIVMQAENQINAQMQNGGLTTGGLRKISTQLFKNLDDKSIANVFVQCERLLNERKWQLGVIAYDWAYKVRKQYDDTTFDIFESWLKNYVKSWGDCDDFCTHAFGYLLGQKNELMKKVMLWVKDENFAVRRAVPVILIYPIKHNMYGSINPFAVSNALLHDEHYLVLKGYGWMLKVLSQVEPQKVIDYLTENKKIMPRISFRYALEKLDKNVKDKLMDK